MSDKIYALKNNPTFYMCGLNLITQEESHTSKCSSIDLEPIKRHDEYVGLRVRRGLFRTGVGK